MRFPLETATFGNYFSNNFTKMNVIPYGEQKIIRALSRSGVLGAWMHFFITITEIHFRSIIDSE